MPNVMVPIEDTPRHFPSMSIQQQKQFDNLTSEEFVNDIVTAAQVKPVLRSKNRRKMLNPSEYPIATINHVQNNSTPAFYNTDSKEDDKVMLKENDKLNELKREPSAEAIYFQHNNDLLDNNNL